MITDFQQASRDTRRVPTLTMRFGKTLANTALLSAQRYISYKPLKKEIKAAVERRLSGETDADVGKAFLALLQVSVPLFLPLGHTVLSERLGRGFGLGGGPAQ